MQILLLRICTGAKEALTLKQKNYVTKGYKEVYIKIKYIPSEASSRFSLDLVYLPVIEDLPFFKQ